MKRMLFFAVMTLACLAGSQVKGQVIPAAATDVSPMLVGEVIPDAMLTGANGQSVSLYSLINKPTVIIFYRGEWCSNCTNHFKEEIVPHLAEIEGSGYNLIAISPDAPASLMVTSKESGLDAKYLFGDGPGALSKAMGLAWKQQERLYERLTQSSGGKNTDYILPVTAVYVIEPVEKKIAFTHITPMGIAAANRMKWSLLNPVLQALK